MEKQVKILAVENETTRKFLHHVREKTLYDLITVPSGIHVVEELGRIVNQDGLPGTMLGEQVDVIILDTTLPGAEGVEALRVIRQNPRLQGVKVIMIGTRPGVQDMVDALISGASDYVVKPFAINELVARVENQIKRKREDENRSELEARYQAMMSMAEGVIMHSASGVVLTCNPSATRLLGISDEYLATHVSLAPGWKFVDQEGVPLEEDEIPFLYTVRSGESLNNVVVGIQKEAGAPVETWLSMNTRALFHADEKRPYAVVSSFSDVSERKWTADGLKESEERFRVLTESSPIAIFIIQGESFIYVNPAFEKLTGYTFEEAKLLHSWDLIHPSQVTVAMDRVLARMTGDSSPSSHLEYRIVTKQNETRYMNISIARIEIQGEVSIMGSAVDITDHKRAESVLWDIRLTANLGTLAAGVAEEVHDPIKIASMAVNYLKEQTDIFARQYLSGHYQKEDIHAFLRSVAEADMLITAKLSRATEILQSFMQFSRDHALLEKRLFNLEHYLQEVMFSMKGQFKNTPYTIELKCPEDILIQSFPDAFMQIFSNLISNSLVHGFGGLLEGNIVIDVTVKDGIIHIVYRDNGKGMDEKRVRDIFNPFSNRAQGSSGGLGMHIVYSLVTQTLKGQITCTSNPGHGVIFHIQFPV